ncbi:MAG: NUDIX domain-containing protein [Pseudomonadota bacterium]
MIAPLFFFGSLRDRDLLEVVLGRNVEPTDLVSAEAGGFRTLQLGAEAYPYLAPAVGHSSEGVVVQNLTPTDISRLEYFEEAEYGLAPIDVRAADGLIAAQFFKSTDKLPATQIPWDFSAWLRDEKPVAMEAARELMAHIDIVPLEESDRIWHGIKIRALMRVRAAAEVPVTGGLRTGRGPGDVISEEIGRPYTEYFAIEEHRLRHRLFNGGMSAPIQRTAVTSGDAVTIVPYDPTSDRVMLIEQFRAAMFARGDTCPWGIEAIAGRIDKELSAEACARREAEEEGGLTLGRVEQIAAYYSSPGFVAEHITSFVGEADLSGSGGVFGLDVENEDIRAFTCTFDEAMAAVGRGEINNAPAVLTIQWLALNRQRLKADWG